MTVFLPEVVLAHAIVERTAAIESLKELNDIVDLEVCYKPWSWRRMSNSVSEMLRRALCCCPARNSQTEAVSEHDQVEIGPPSDRRKKVRWTLTHSYYANMGGLRLGVSGDAPVCKLWASEFSTIALTTRQFAYLRKTASPAIQATPDISEEEIKDKSKTDYFAKSIAVAQIFWLILSLIGRAARHLAISQLEILTTAFAACAIVTYCFAWNKPQSVDTATNILATEPLDARDTRRVIQLQPKDLGVLLAGATDIREGPQFNRIHNGNFELSEGRMQPISFWLVCTVMVFGSIHLSAWNFRFPTSAERILWRIGSIATTVLPLLFLLSSSISSASHAMEEELHRFENSIISLWEDYVAETPDAPPPIPSAHMLLGDLIFEVPGWTNKEENLAAFYDFVNKQANSEEGRTRAADFEWLLAEIVGRSFESSRDFFHRHSSGRELTLRLRKRQGTQLSLLEKAALDDRQFGSSIFLVVGLIYVVFRLLIILLSFISLRAMPDTVYDSTWAKNLPSVQ